MKIQILTGLLILAFNTTTSAKDIYIDCYSVREKIFAGKTFLGYYEATARITKKSSVFFISFLVSMPDSGQVLESDKNIAIQSKVSNYTFNFTDGWENTGKGKLSISGNNAILNLKEEKVAEGGNNILRNYGTHNLKKVICK